MGNPTRWTLAPVILLTLYVLVAPLMADAQPAAKVPRIGVLFTGTPATAAQVSEAFNLGLRERGYVEGKSIVVERRFGDAQPERLSALAGELVRMKVDVIVTSVDEAIATFKRQTQTIPIVMTAASDPVATGFVASLAHPGGNITGLTGLSPELNVKRLELLKEVVPGLTRVAIMWDPGIRGALLEYKATEEAARSLRLQLQSVEVTLADDIGPAFSVFTTGRAEALIVVSSTLTLDKRSQIASLALKHRLPSINGPRTFPEAGDSWPMGRVSTIGGVAPPYSWTRSSREPSRVTCLSSSPPSSNSSST